MRNLAFRKDIQGLRAIAVIAVMIFHFDRNLLPGGYVGVDIFFVISGFLITSILLNRKRKKELSSLLILKEFYLSRIRRLAPAYYVLLIFVAILSAILFIPKDYQFFHQSFQSAIFFLGNQYFSNFGDYFAPKSDELPLLHTWSLAIEMQFYFFYPVLILLVSISWLKKITPILVLFVLLFAAYQGWSGNTETLYYSFYLRIPEFLLGGFVALYAQELYKYRCNSFAYFGFIFVVISLFFIDEGNPFPSIYSFMGAVGASMILIGPSDKGIAKCLSLSILVSLGAISYSLYLWHWPILAFIRYVTGNYHLSVGHSILYLMVSLLLASASYYLIEQRFRIRSTSSILVKSLLVGSLIGGLLTAFFVLPNLNKNLVVPVEVKKNRYADPALICHGKIVGDCIRGDRSSKQKPFLVLGDSHAAMLNYFFDVVGEELGLSFRVITASSCVTIPSFDASALEKWAQEACQKQIIEIKEEIKLADNIVIAGKYSYQLQQNHFRDSLIAFLEDSETKQKQVYLLSDVPYIEHFHPVRNSRFNQLKLPVGKVTVDDEVPIANKVIQKLSAKYSNTYYLDLSQNEIFRQDIQTYYYDNHHLHEEASRVYAQQSMMTLKKYWSR